MENMFEQVEKNIDNLVVNNVDWTACASTEQLQAAREGNLRLQFFDRNVPKEWLKNIKGKRVLCLAVGGGLQAPLLACAGAEVTVIDISNKMFIKCPFAPGIMIAQIGLNMDIQWKSIWVA